MKKNLVLSICLLGVLFSSSVFAQEALENIESEVIVPEDILIIENNPMQEEILSDVIPAEAHEESMEKESIGTVIPAEAGIQSSILINQNMSLIQPENAEQILNTESPTVNYLIRNGENILFNSNIEFGTNTVNITDYLGKNHSIPENSVLGVLKKIDDANNNFEISNVQYYDSFGALYLKCIKVSNVEYCDNWQYVVDGFSPWTGIDATLLNGNENVGIYFGSPYQIVFDTSIYSIDNPIFVTAQKYNYQNNIWEARTGVTVGLTVTNPLDIWTPIELETKLVGADGKSFFTIATSGDYVIGIKDDWYYPSYSIFVSTTTASTTTSTSTDTSNSGGGSSNTKIFNLDKAIAFLKNLQGSDGSYGGSELYSDWAAIAFGSVGIDDSKLLNYLKSKSKIKDLLTDNERRAMALLSLEKNPYDFNGVNYIDSILKEFDGNQFGDKNLINDDIFALIVLSQTGYESSDIEIVKSIQFIISKQNSNGSFENSFDLTASTIQAFNQFNSVSGVNSSISKAKSYLKNSQKSDGGWGSEYSTSWVAQAMYSLGENWSKDNKTVEDYFYSIQNDDGGVLSEDETKQNRIWATSYVISAISGKTWDEIMSDFSKKEIDLKNNNQDKDNSLISTSTVSTTTIPIIEETIEDISTTTLSLLSNELIVKEKILVNEDIPIEDKKDIEENKEVQKTKTELSENNSEIAISWLKRVSDYIGNLFERLWGIIF